VPLSDLFGAETLFARYLDGADALLLDQLPHFAGGAKDWLRPASAPVTVDAEAREKFLHELADTNAALGVDAALVERVRKASAGSIRFVVTGQQPGAVGGPLMTLYKIASAIAVAREVEEKAGVQCVPLYWVGSDDVDFSEIRELVLVTDQLEPVSSKFNSTDFEAGSAVGNVSASADRQLWEGVSDMISNLPGAGRVSGVLSDCLRDGGDHGEVVARLLVVLTKGMIAVVDGRDPGLRRVTRDLILKYFDDEDEVKSMVAASGEQLASAGYHAQLELGTDSGVFLVQEGRRQKVPVAKREDARQQVENDITSASAGVVLRNLIQDAVFQPVAVVLGPAEVAYRAQLASAYLHMGVERPIVFPRMFATVVPSEIAEAGAHTRVPMRDLVIEPLKFRSAVYTGMVDPETSEVADDLLVAFRSNSRLLLEAAAKALDERGIDKFKKRIADTEKRLIQTLLTVNDTGKVAALQRWPGLAYVTDLFARREKPQERYLSLLTPFLFGNPDAIDSILELAASHVAATMDGHPEHVVYSFTL